MEPTVRKELRDILLALILFLLGLGYSVSGLPANIIVACVIWAFAWLFLTDLFFILEWTERCPNDVKIIIWCGLTSLVLILMWNPVRAQYARERTPPASPAPTGSPGQNPPSQKPPRRISKRVSPCDILNLLNCPKEDLRSGGLFLARQINNVYLFAENKRRNAKHVLYAANTEQQQQDAQRSGDSRIRFASQDAVRDYVENYQRDAKLYRKALQSIVIGHKNQQMDYVYDNPGDYFAIQRISNDLRELASAVHVATSDKQPDNVVEVLSALADRGLVHITAQKRCSSGYFQEWVNQVSDTIDKRVPQYAKLWAMQLDSSETTPQQICSHADVQMTKLENIIDSLIKEERQE